MKILSAVYICALILFFWPTSPAESKLRICNESGSSRSVAIAFKEGDEWRSEGWWNIEDQQCKTVEGQELKQRYYYYRATHNGQEIKPGDYVFCTTKKSFEIIGDENCEARGFRASSFHAIDTGKSAKSFKFTLKFALPDPKKEEKKAAKKQESQKKKSTPTVEMTQAPRFTGAPFTPGSLGEPYTVIGVFQGCDNIDGWDHCAYHAEGWRHGASWGEGTPDSIMSALEKTEPGTRLLVRGDMKSFGDITAEVAIRQIEPIPYEPLDSILEAMQGSWESDEDSGAYFTIHGSERREFYDGNLTANEYLSWHTGCQHVPQGSGTYMIATNPENRDDPLCYNVVSVGRNHLILNYVGGNGQDLNYTRQN